MFHWGGGEGSAPSLSLPSSLPPPSLCLVSVDQFEGTPSIKVPVGGQEGGDFWGCSLPDVSAPFTKTFKSCVPACTSPCQSGAGGSLWRMGLRRGEGGGGWWESFWCWDGRRGQGMQSDAGGWLCCGLLFTVPQSARLLLVPHTHLLRYIDQRAGHGQTCAHRRTRLVKVKDIKLQTWITFITLFLIFCHINLWTLYNIKNVQSFKHVQIITLLHKRQGTIYYDQWCTWVVHRCACDMCTPEYDHLKHRVFFSFSCERQPIRRQL